MRAALRREADRRGTFLSDEVMDYLLTRFARDLKHLMAQLDRLDEFSLASKRAITVPLLKQMLAEEGGADEPGACSISTGPCCRSTPTTPGASSWSRSAGSTRAAFRAGNDAFYADYRAGRLDIDAYIAFATAPLRERSARRARRRARALHARGGRAGAAGRRRGRWSSRTASAATGSPS